MSVGAPFSGPGWPRPAPQGALGVRLRSAILAFAASSPNVAAAHWPINSPALKLSVAKVASAASIGSSGVSRAITRIPASLACFTTGTMALVSEALIDIPVAREAMQVSSA